ncbi:hypothetical protein CKK33_05825 [Mucilaginibacter sp. MD40]|uniref:hypothetical protein n=1 Tax=Mucilaginibacter sp. MD40 TaxID=2029590 RepID=UPI000BAC4DAA|nr:hypothetical protein [Mucilaginibacter sp. MD40]PAW93038.1 hypothetical protein CKK33_05825 [Mucilaginibacter sp. MD40]
MTFRHLLGSIDIELFRTDFWGKKTLLIQRNDNSYYNTIICKEQIESFFKRRDLRFSDVSLLESIIPIDEYAKPIEARQFTNERLVYPPALLEHYKNGEIICIKNPEKSFSGVRKCQFGLVKEFNTCIDISLFLIPVKKGDTILRNTKNCLHLIISGILSAQTDDTDFKHLAAGDLLYISEEEIAYSAVSEDVIILQLHLNTPTFYNLLSDTLEHVIENYSIIRESIIPQFCDHDFSEKLEEIKNLIENEAGLVFKNTIEKNCITINYVDQSDRFFDYLQLKSISSETIVAIRQVPATEILIGDPDNYALLKLTNNSLFINKAQYDIVEKIVAVGRLTVREALTVEENDIKFIEVLIEKGLLKINNE